MNLSKKAYQPFWQMPLDDYTLDNTTGDVADLRNTGKQTYGGAGTAAKFLE